MSGKRGALSVAATLALAATPALLAQQIPLVARPGLDGARLFRDYACNSCHGEGGRNGLPGHPILAGQDPQYLMEQLLAFKAGQRANGMAQTMIGTVATIPNDELTAIALYLSAQSCK
jgi:cytochrome c553